MELTLRVFSMMLLSCTALWATAVLAIRVHLFHSFYIHHLQSVEDEKWLRVQCDDPVFFSNLKQHVSLCAQVQENAQRNPFLVALNETMQNSSMCGIVSCWDLISGVQNASLNTMLLLTLGAVLVVAVILPSANIVTRFLYESNPSSLHYASHESQMAVYRDHSSLGARSWPRYPALDLEDVVISPPTKKMV